MPQAVTVPYLSFIIPLMNEEDSVSELVQRIAQECQSLKLTYEILLINDGSTDGTAKVIENLYQHHPQVGCISFRRNFGKAAALQMGFDRARGTVMITMDGDLQDDPKEIPRLIHKIQEGYDCVSGWKQKRNDPLSKTLPSKLFNWAVGFTSGIRLHDFNCGFKAYRREAAKDLNLYGELHRFIPVLLHWRGFKVTEIAVEHHARRHGTSKYGTSRLLKGFFDLVTVTLITRFSTRPLHLFGFMGISVSLLGLGILFYLSIGWLMGHGIDGRPLFFLGILLTLVGVQIMCTGLIGEIINRSQQDFRQIGSMSEENPIRQRYSIISEVQPRQ